MLRKPLENQDKMAIATLLAAVLIWFTYRGRRYL